MGETTHGFVSLIDWARPEDAIPLVALVLHRVIYGDHYNGYAVVTHPFENRVLIEDTRHNSIKLSSHRRRDDLDLNADPNIGGVTSLNSESGLIEYRLTWNCLP